MSNLTDNRSLPEQPDRARREVLASRSRSEEAGVSKATRQRQATPRCDATTRGPEGWGGDGPSAALQRLDVSRGCAVGAASCSQPLGAPNAPDPVSRIDSKCCDRCWHTRSRPCPELLECILSGPRCHESALCTEARQQELRRLRRACVDRPVIFVGTGTCGLGAGAGKTLVAVRAYLDERGIDADVVEVGCIGWCVSEPLVDVQLPGRTRACPSPTTA